MWTMFIIILKIKQRFTLITKINLWIFIPLGLSRFFHNGRGLRRHAVSLIISKIRSILRWFESQTLLHFYASSLLLVYEGSPHTINKSKHTPADPGTEHQQGEPQSKAWSFQSSLTYSHPYCHDDQHERNANGKHGGSVEELDEEIGMGDKKQFGQEETVEVKMIDFAHVFPSDSPDESYMYGLRNLLSALEQILKDWHLSISLFTGRMFLTVVLKPVQIISHTYINIADALIWKIALLYIGIFFLIFCDKRVHCIMKTCCNFQNLRLQIRKAVTVGCQQLIIY